MAPTLLGLHRDGVCPHCDGKSAVPEQPPGFPEFPHLDGICIECQKVGQPNRVGERLIEGDRIMSNKLLSPRRWDMIVFRYPEDPSIKYVARLVALPGETLVIKDGGVWIDGQRLEPPAHLKGLRWVSEIRGHRLPHGSEEEPLKLGAAEYAVLGDFSINSSDSRSWGPVPGANIEGVVALTYWPPSRWKIHR